MADSTTSPAGSTDPPIASQPESTAANTNSQPDSSQSPAPPPLNPNPNYFNSNPQIQPYAPSSFRPAPAFPGQLPPHFSVPVPQPGVQPPGVTVSAPPGIPIPGGSVPPMVMQYPQPGQPMRMPYLPPSPYPGMPHPGIPRFATPYNALVRPPFPPRPPGTVGAIPPLSRPPALIRAPFLPPVVRPAPIVAPVEKPQTIVYVGKIASRVDNDFMLSLLQLCGPVKSWKRYQDPSTGTLKNFGFCEFESAEGVLRALRLLNKLNIDGQELMLKVDQATRGHLKLHVEKKVESTKSSKETESKEAEANEVVADGNESETKLDGCETQEDPESASFGLVTDEDRTADHEVLEKLTAMLEERMKSMPLPPPPPLTPANASALSESQREGESDVDARRKAEGNDETSDQKPTSEHERTEQGSPDRSRKDERRSKDRERDLKREKERELERIEREREQERAKREKERDYKIREDERRYKVHEKDWEAREKDKEHYRKREREREKERAQERKWEIVDQERENDDGHNKRRKHRSSDEERRRRHREKEDDLADKLREEEEIAEAKKIAEEEAQKTLQQEALKALAQHADNGIAKPFAPDENYITSKEKPFDHNSDHDEDMAEAEGTLQNGDADELEGHHNSNVPVRKLGFGLSGSGKRTAVPSVFYEDEEEDKHKDKMMRPLVPLDYSTEEQPPTSEAPLAESAKRSSNVNSKEERPDVDRERSRRHHDRSSQRERDRHDGESKNGRDENAKESSGRDKGRDHGTEKVKTAGSKKLLDAKQLIDMIPKTKEELFSYKINWDIYEEHNLHERMEPWISKKITEFLGEEEPTLVQYIVSTTHDHVKATTMLENLQAILDEEAEMFVLKMWRMLIFEIKKVETGLAFRHPSYTLFEVVDFIEQIKNDKLYLEVSGYKMAEFIEKVSLTVKNESQQVQENASEVVENVAGSVGGVAGEGKEKVEETKKSISSFVSHGLSKVEGLVHSGRDYVDKTGTDLQGKMGQVSGSLATFVKKAPGVSAEKKSEEADPLPVSGGSSSPSPAVATDRGVPENQPLLTDTAQTRTSWTNCCGLFDCFTSSDR